MKYFDLFSGIGGFSYGIKSAINAECVGYSEIDRWAKAIYNYNYPEHINFGDIQKVNTIQIPTFDLLVAGFPCQAFSHAGRGGGFNDCRGTLFFEIGRILADKKPTYFLLENVKYLLSNDKGRTFQTMVRVLSSMGYRIEWQVLNSRDFGVPHSRERVYIIGYPGDEPRPEIFPLSRSRKAIRRKAGRDISYPIDANYYKGPNKGNHVHRQLIKQGGFYRQLTPTEIERLQGFPELKKRTKICINMQQTNANVAIQKQKTQKHAGNVEKDKLPKNVSFVAQNFNQKNLRNKKLAPNNVHINCAGGTLEIHNQRKLLLSANGAGNTNWSPHHIQIEDFAHLVVHIHLIAEKIITHGKVALQKEGINLTRQKNGEICVNISGKEIIPHANFVDKNITKRTRFLKSITLFNMGLKYYVQTLKTLLYYAINVINGFIPKEMFIESSLGLIFESKYGWTQYGLEGNKIKNISKTQRYRTLGNAVTTNVVEEIIKRWFA